MPVCKKCGYKNASSAFRRSPKGGYLCIDKTGCSHDRKIRNKGGEPGPGPCRSSSASEKRRAGHLTRNPPS